jgi:F-type H+-transporting ATPase subunit b
MSILIIFVLSTVAFAAGGGDAVHHEFPKMPIIWHAVNLGILLSGMIFLLRKPIMHALANRAATVKRDIDEANRLRRDAQHRMEDLELRLSGFEAELEQMQQAAETDAQKEREAILARAEVDAERIREAAQRSIRDETVRARASLRREAAQLGIALARERLQSSITSADQGRLNDDFLTAVKDSGQESHHG